MLEEQSGAIEERRTEQEEMEVTMTDNEQPTPTRQEITDKKRNNISERPASITGANRQ
jgi:hypothetical protein